MNKGWKKTGRKFVDGSKNSNCRGVVSWCVTYYPAETSEKIERSASFDADFGVNEEAQSHWITRKADLRPLRTIRAELDKFEDACLAAIEQVEKSNAKSK